MTIQPCIDEDGNVLLWNGDVFSGNSLESGESDTSFILRTFQSTNVVSTLEKIKGPYSFVYYQKSTNTLYFARDSFGRHSLLVNFNSVNNSLTFTSVTSRKLQQTLEIPAIGIFALNLSNFNFLNLNIICFPWQKADNLFYENIKKLETYFNTNVQIEKVVFPSKEESPNSRNIDEKYFHVNMESKNFENIMEFLLKRGDIFERVEKLENLLKESIETRIKKQPSYCKNCIKLINKNDIECCHTKIGILFSGGLDSSILSVIADNFIPENESIDLINVAFEKNSKNQNEETYNVPDRKTGRQSLADLKLICPKRNWNFIEVGYSKFIFQSIREKRGNYFNQEKPGNFF